MPRLEFTTSNTQWLEETIAREGDNPEEVLSRLEDMLEAGEITHGYIEDHYNHKKAKDMKIEKDILTRGNRNKPAPKPAPKPTLLTNTSVKYLRIAFTKATDALHPNFRRALKPAALEIQLMIREASSRAFDSNPDNVRQGIIDTGKALKHEARAYVQFYKDVMANAAFAAHMDCVQLERQVDEELLDQGLDAMGDSHPADNGDIPLNDANDADRAFAREPYEGGERQEPTATSVEDAEEAINGVQAWIGLSVTGMPAESRLFWGVDGLFPLGSKKIGEDWVSIQNFREYREYQTAEWKRKRNAVTIDSTAEDLMRAG